MIFYFSGSGNSHYAAYTIAEKLNTPLVSMAECLKTNSMNFDARQDKYCGFVFPIHFWGVPYLVTNFIKNMQLKMNEDTYVFAVFTCGGSTGSADKMLQKLLNKHNINLSSVFSVKQIDIFVPFFKIPEKDKREEVILKSQVDIESIVNHIINLTDGYIKASNGSFAGGAYLSHTKTKTRAFFKIQDGCDACCTYCIIPELRGKPKSMPKDEVISGFKKLLSLGYKEIVLVGIHIGLYGKDLGLNITDILEELVKIEGDFRIRLTSIEINEIDDRLLNLIKNNKKICPHLHIPLQSGCDKILSLMGRKYKKDDYINIIAKARKLIPNVTIGSDIIAGFPSETDEDFNDTLKTLQSAGTEFYHAFPYSERKGTVAENMENKVDVKIREERAALLRQQGLKSLMNLYNNSIGKTYRVLSEKGSKGHTENYMLIHYDKNTEPNKFIDVLVTEIKDNKLFGKVVEK